MKETEETIKNRGFWKNYVKIGKIIGNRHTVIFPDRGGEPTKITYCNYCGRSFIIDGKCSCSSGGLDD